MQLFDDHQEYMRFAGRLNELWAEAFKARGRKAMDQRIATEGGHANKLADITWTFTPLPVVIPYCASEHQIQVTWPDGHKTHHDSPFDAYLTLDLESRRLARQRAAQATKEAA